MRMLLLVAAATSLVAGCTPEMQGTLDKACSTARTAHAAYTIAAEGELVPARLAGQVDAAWKGVRLVCENPPRSTEQAVLTVTAATVIFVKAVKQLR